MPDIVLDSSSLADLGDAVGRRGAMDISRRIETRDAAALRILIVLYSTTDGMMAKVSKALAQDQDRLADLTIRIEECAPTSDAAFAQYIAVRAQSEQALLIVSDRFGSGNANITGLASFLRERCADAKAIMAMLALADPPLGRIPLVDNVVARDADGAALACAIEQTLRAIRYKYPPASRRPAGADFLQLHRVSDTADLRLCLALRYSVYKQLGYFHEHPDSEPLGLELGYYDPSALHFIALAPGGPSPRIAGTARLIVAGTQSWHDGPFGDTAHLRMNSERLCESLLAQEPALRKNLEVGPGTAALPLFAAFSALDLTPEKEVSWLAELSRVVVAEEFRGLGVSRLLVRACIAAAVALRRRYILLECIPQHELLYQKFGFTKVANLKHQRAWGIDQLATVMRLGLVDEPTNVAVQTAKRDLEMMGAPRVVASTPAGLCLCRDTRCWERGAYENRGRPNCPLKSSFVQ